MFAPIQTLTARLTKAGFHVGAVSDLPPPTLADRILNGATPPQAAPNAGPAGAAQVTALIAAEARLRKAGLTYLADKLQDDPVFLITDNPNNVMATTSEGVLLNVRGVAVTTDKVPLDGAPWSRVEAVEAVKAGTPKAKAAADMLEAAAVHEAGHVLDFAASAHTLPMAEALEHAIPHPYQAEEISRYAASDDSEEASAEAFSKAVYGRPLPKALNAWKARALAFARSGGRF